MAGEIGEIAKESPEAAGLAYDLITASMNATHRTMDTLLEREREHRQALEVLIDDVLDRLDHAHMGSAREYEQAVKPLRVGIYGRMSELAARHRENEGS